MYEYLSEWVNEWRNGQMNKEAIKKPSLDLTPAHCWGINFILPITVPSLETCPVGKGKQTLNCLNTLKRWKCRTNKRTEQWTHSYIHTYSPLLSDTHTHSWGHDMAPSLKKGEKYQNSCWLTVPPLSHPPHPSAVLSLIKVKTSEERCGLVVLPLYTQQGLKKPKDLATAPHCHPLQPRYSPSSLPTHNQSNAATVLNETPYGTGDSLTKGGAGPK